MTDTNDMMITLNWRQATAGGKKDPWFTCRLGPSEDSEDQSEAVQIGVYQPLITSRLEMLNWLRFVGDMVTDFPIYPYLFPPQDGYRMLVYEFDGIHPEYNTPWLMPLADLPATEAVRGAVIAEKGKDYRSSPGVFPMTPLLYSLVRVAYDEIVLPRLMGESEPTSDGE
jgi:hypothetical protein